MAIDLKAMSFKEAKNIVRDKLATDPRWLVKGLVAIYKRQTADEQRVEHTELRNQVGFNSADSNMLTGFAKQWMQREWFSDKQIGILKRKMAKYAGQLAKIARDEIPVVAG